VVKGGRRFGFAALVVVGDGKGRVGYGQRQGARGAGSDPQGDRAGQAQMVRVPLREGRTLHHDIKGRFGAGHVLLRAAPPGTGIIAGGPMRAVFEALGVQDVVAKSLGSSNPHNMVKATFEALERSVRTRRAWSQPSAARRCREIIGKRGAAAAEARE
jgi:small subunit ribosomal protein S5